MIHTRNVLGLDSLFILEIVQSAELTGSMLSEEEKTAMYTGLKKKIYLQKDQGRPQIAEKIKSVETRIFPY